MGDYIQRVSVRYGTEQISLVRFGDENIVVHRDWSARDRSIRFEWTADKPRVIPAIIARTNDGFDIFVINEKGEEVFLRSVLV